MPEELAETWCHSWEVHAEELGLDRLTSRVLDSRVGLDPRAADEAEAADLAAQVGFKVEVSDQLTRLLGCEDVSHP
jgi:hypothetical protein